MLLNIDPAWLRTYMKLWRDGVNHVTPMAPEFKLHFIQERPTILRNFEQTSSAWLMVLRKAQPVESDQQDFDTLIAEIEEFHDWAAGELKEIDDLAIQTMLEAGVDELRTSDPALYKRMMESFKGIIPPRPGSTGKDD